MNLIAQQLDEVSDDRHFLKKVNAGFNGVRIRGDGPLHREFDMHASCVREWC